jgi:hypothetical protein
MLSDLQESILAGTVQEKKKDAKRNIIRRHRPSLVQEELENDNGIIDDVTSAINVYGNWRGTRKKERTNDTTSTNVSALKHLFACVRANHLNLDDLLLGTHIQLLDIPGEQNVRS